MNPNNTMHNKIIELLDESRVHYNLMRIDLKKLRPLIASKKNEMATPEKVKKITDVEGGSVPPFGNLIDIPVYFDSTLSKEPKNAFSVGTNNMIIAMSTSGCIKI